MMEMYLASFTLLTISLDKYFVSKCYAFVWNLAVEVAHLCFFVVNPPRMFVHDRIKLCRQFLHCAGLLLVTELIRPNKKHVMTCHKAYYIYYLRCTYTCSYNQSVESGISSFAAGAGTFSNDATEI